MPEQTVTKKDQLMKDWQDFISENGGLNPTKYVKTSTTPFSEGSREVIMFLSDEDSNGWDLGEKIRYDLETYNDDLIHKFQTKISIESWYFGFIEEDED